MYTVYVVYCIHKYDNKQGEYLSLEFMMPSRRTRIGIGKEGHSLVLSLELAPLLILLLLYLGLYSLSVQTEALPVLASKGWR